MPKTLELNGLVERMNRTIMERVRSMLSHAKLPKSYWAEALYTTIYLINRSPSVPLKGDVPQRVWIGKDVSYQHLKVFRWLAYMHVAKDKRSKLDNKSKPCIFSGYLDDEFSYRLWDMLNKKVERSQNIVCMEDKVIDDWKQQKSEVTSESAPTVVDSGLVNLPQSAAWRILVGTAKFELVNSEQLTNTDESELAEPQKLTEVYEAHESESVDLQQPIDMYESEPNEELANTSESERIMGGGRYPLRKRKASSWYPASQYVLLTDEDEPECYEEAMVDEHKEK